MYINADIAAHIYALNAEVCAGTDVRGLLRDKTTRTLDFVVHVSDVPGLNAGALTKA